jgi:K+-transporting ATPase A subunit
MKLLLAYVLAIPVTVLILGVIVIVGGLIYFPMLILGPIGERFIG